MPELLTAVGISKGFTTAHRDVHVLERCDLLLAAGESVGILGASGSGKSTLLQILGTLDTPDTGTLHYRGEDMLSARQNRLSRFRRDELGFIFQFHHLLPEFSALENVALPALIARDNKGEAFRRAGELLDRVGMSHRSTHRPGELSGGEQQRVAVVRALMNRPSLVMADEPTGNLDEVTGLEVADELFRLIREEGASLIIVTHDKGLAARTGKSLQLTDGVLKAV
jgi:lipoprotein-releasing system ATP-binding protein